MANQIIAEHGAEILLAASEPLLRRDVIMSLTLVIHAVHDGHQLLQPGHGLLFVAFAHEVGSKAWDHALNASQRGGRV